MRKCSAEGARTKDSPGIRTGVAC